MEIKKAIYKKVRVMQTKMVKDSVYGCDECRKEIVDYPNEPTRLDLTIFHQSGDTERKHYCSWRCVLKNLKKIKTDYFISLPNVMFDQGKGKKTGASLIRLLSKIR